VIEHLHDPAGAVAAAHALLNPGGQLVVITPNSRASGLERWGAAWMGLDPPRHLCVFSASGLEKTMEAAGFDEVTHLRSAPTARSLERHSLAISEGRLPFADDAPNAPILTTKIQTAKERVFPSRSEELVFSARRGP